MKAILTIVVLVVLGLLYAVGGAYAFTYLLGLVAFDQGLIDYSVVVFLTQLLPLLQLLPPLIRGVPVPPLAVAGAILVIAMLYEAIDSPPRPPRPNRLTPEALRLRKLARRQRQAS